MNQSLCIRGVLFAMALLALSSRASHADLEYQSQSTPDGVSYLVVHGRFEATDSLVEFTRAVTARRPAAVTFNSPGGNVAKAMELGRLIRSFNLSTMQIRNAECASACSLSFLGGVSRAAEPGSIGVHKSSFNDTTGLQVHDAVSMVQQITAEVIGYMNEMGVDPGLLQLSLSYDSNDIRYLSGSEMARYRVTTVDGAARASEQVAAAPKAFSRPVNVVSLSIPQARSGIVQHPKGRAPVKAGSDADAKSRVQLKNGTPVDIARKVGDWYEVSAGGSRGFMHYSWVWVEEFEQRKFGQRFIQVKSFDDLDEASKYVRSSPIALAAHLAANGWFAVTLKETFSEGEARAISSALKDKGAIPSDSLVTFGNTYVRQVCCE
ncbi:SH3 domain-containing protein [Mycoplana dimorpha]|nr:SH3 domain-containing protein [Mycoplana dimorpha]